MKEIKLFIFVLSFVAAGFSAANAQLATGSGYTLEQSVIGAGGGTSSGGAGNIYKIESVIGESVAGTTSTNSPYTVKGGFFTAQALAPTAADVIVSGRVMTSSGKGIRNIVVTMIDASGAIRTTLSGASGRFIFEAVTAGETYVFSASGRRFTFNQPAQIHSITEATDSIVFVGEPINLQPQ